MVRDLSVMFFLSDLGTIKLVTFGGGGKGMDFHNSVAIFSLILEFGMCGRGRAEW